MLDIRAILVRMGRRVTIIPANDPVASGARALRCRRRGLSDEGLEGPEGIVRFGEWSQ
ncbi:hypothetical protein [Streptomyces sp. NPDC057579]|uniref:hypothetical protein n=1 Tax=Streptomyces sp. NPDC057579 TaxID=3346172 RepID=UPI0036B6A683